LRRGINFFALVSKHEVVFKGFLFFFVLFVPFVVHAFFEFTKPSK